MNATPAPAGPPPPSRCWNCQEPLSAGSARCLFCGVVQQSAPAAQPAAAAAPTAAAAAPAAAPAYAPAVATAVQQPQPVRVAGGVSPGANFAGTIASTGARIVAFTIDVIVVIAVCVAVLQLTGNAVYATLALVELVIGLWVLEARTGLTIGNALLRLRVSREDAPYSPGIGRSFVRSLITGIGFLVFAIGAWIVVASSGFDGSRRGRSWADRAARTLVVSVPRRERVFAPTTIAMAPGPLPAGVVPVGGVAPTAVHAQPAPGVQIVPAEAPIVLAAPQVISTAARPATVNEVSASASHTGVNPGGFVASPVPLVATPLVPAADSADAAESASGALLLVFDTGQREQLATPVAVNLGRNPVVTEPTDKLITVTDPESSVSKTHLRLEHSRGSTWVTDGGSTNGTELLSDEGEVTRLTAGQRVLVDEGSRVRVGNRTFTISILLGDNS